MQGLPPQQFPGPPSLAPVAADSRALADAFLESLGAEDSTAGVPKEDNSSGMFWPAMAFKHGLFSFQANSADRRLVCSYMHEHAILPRAVLSAPV